MEVLSLLLGERLDIREPDSNGLQYARFGIDRHVDGNETVNVLDVFVHFLESVRVLDFFDQSFLYVVESALSVPYDFQSVEFLWT